MTDRRYRSLRTPATIDSRAFVHPRRGATGSSTESPVIATLQWITPPPPQDRTSDAPDQHLVDVPDTESSEFLMGVTASLPSFRSSTGLYDDVTAQRALAYLEPILARTARMGHEPVAFEWANRVYLVHKLLRDRKQALGTVNGRREWQRVFQAVHELVQAAVATPEHAFVVTLMAALDGTRAVQPASPEWIAARAAYADWLEGQGMVAEALAIYALTTGPGWATLPAEPMLEAVLTTARLYRRLARWESSLLAYERAGELADAENDENGRLRAELGRGLVATGRGNYPEAIGILTELCERAAGASRNMRARIIHDLSVAHERAGSLVDALVSSLKALELYDDHEDRLNVFGSIGNLLGAMGLWETSLMVHTCVRACSKREASRRNAAIDSLPAIARLRQDDFTLRAEALLATVDSMTPSMRVDCRYQAALGYAKLDDNERARTLLAGALADAAEHELNHWYFRIEAALKAVLANTQPQPNRVATQSASATGGDARLAPLLVGVEGAAHRFAAAV